MYGVRVFLIPENGTLAENLFPLQGRNRYRVYTYHTGPFLLQRATNAFCYIFAHFPTLCKKWSKTHAPLFTQQVWTRSPGKGTATPAWRQIEDDCEMSGVPHNTLKMAQTS